MTQVHLLNPFRDAHGGSEQRTLALYELLRPHAEVTLWSSEPPLAGDALPYTVEVIDPERGQVPNGGNLVIVGSYFAAELVFPWLRPRRVIYIYNTPGPRNFARRLRLVRELMGIEPEIVYAAPEGAQGIGLPGRFEASPIDLERFHPARRAAGSRDAGRFTIGRVSRDVPEKHHPDDVALYRAALSHGWSLRLMGATCLAATMEPALYRQMEVLPCGALPVEDFLAGLDCFYYRVSDDWNEAFGRVVLEAMAAGLPVVCDAKVGAARLIEQGASGIVTESTEQTMAALRRLADDSVLRHRMGAAARRRAEATYSPDQVAEMIAFYTR